MPLPLLRPLALVVLLVAGAAPAAEAPPWTMPAVTLETGLLWQVGRNTPLSYRLVPTQVSWRSREFLGRELADGSRLVVRHRLTLITSWIQQGPESHYVGVSGSPSLEWWNRAGTWAWFAGAGGGVGAIDSRGVAGGQGQDFTLNWFARAGREYAFTSRINVSVGAMFQHLSNGGQTAPNPGVDAVGITFSGSWRY